MADTPPDKTHPMPTPTLTARTRSSPYHNACRRQRPGAWFQQNIVPIIIHNTTVKTEQNGRAVQAKMAYEQEKEQKIKLQKKMTQ